MIALLHATGATRRRQGPCTDLGAPTVGTHQVGAHQADALPKARSEDHHRSIEMYTMNEALARERMRDARSQTRHARLVREQLAQRRWQRVSRYAQSVENRHAQRVRELAVR